jgi:hypothetical protein
METVMSKEAVAVPSPASAYALMLIEQEAIPICNSVLGEVKFKRFVSSKKLGS